MREKSLKIKKYIGITLLFGIIILLVFGKKIGSETGLIINSNTVFTEDIFNNLKEIDCWFSDEKLAINKEEDIKNVYSYLSSLTLTKALTKNYKAGGIIIDLVTDDKTISLGLLSGELSIDGKRYYTDKNIVDSIRDIALKYQDLYNNDIFTKDLLENLIEIDCWPEDKKIVITKKEAIEDIYYVLSLLTLEEASPEYKVKRKQMRIDFITSDQTISFGLLSNVLCIKDKIYYAESPRDLVELVSSLAQENQ